MLGPHIASHTGESKNVEVISTPISSEKVTFFPGKVELCCQLSLTSTSRINKRSPCHCDSAGLQEGVLLHQRVQFLYQYLRNTHLCAGELDFFFTFFF